MTRDPSPTGLDIAQAHLAAPQTRSIHPQPVDVDKHARAALKGQTPCVLWFTGLSGSGKSTVSNLVEKRLLAIGRHTYLLDGDHVRLGLSKDLGFSAVDRVENIRRIAEVARLMVDAGLIVLTAFISPFRSDRRMARSLFAQEEFIEIFMDVPLHEAERRDPTGLYKKARRGELKDFTGVDSPYEPPLNPDIRLDSVALDAEACAARILQKLESVGIPGGSTRPPY